MVLPGGRSRRSRSSACASAGPHAVVAAAIGTLSVSERELAAGGVLSTLKPEMLVLADRGFSVPL